MKKLNFEKFSKSIFKPLSVSEVNKIKGGIGGGKTFTWSTSRTGDDNGHEDTATTDPAAAMECC